MGDPKVKYDNCRHCDGDVVWMQRLDPNAVKQPDDIDAFASDEVRGRYMRERELFRAWYRDKPAWHGKTKWWHELDDEQFEEGCRGWENPEEPYKRQPMAEPTNFCNAKLKTNDTYYYKDAELCNAPVTYEAAGVCGMHAKPFIEVERQKIAREQRDQEQAALEEQINVVVDHLLTQGIKAKAMGYMGRRTGMMEISMEDIIMLLELADKEKPAPQSSAEDLEVAEGFNPFFDVAVDDDEEEWEEFA